MSIHLLDRYILEPPVVAITATSHAGCGCSFLAKYLKVHKETSILVDFKSHADGLRPINIAF